MWKCLEIDHLNDESKIELAALIPETKRYFGEGVECYEGLYETIQEYLKNMKWNVSNSFGMAHIPPAKAIEIMKEIEMVGELMRNDQQNAMVWELRHLREMIMLA